MREMVIEIKDKICSISETTGHYLYYKNKAKLDLCELKN